VETGNATINNGNFAKTIESILADLKPEAAYITVQRPTRCEKMRSPTSYASAPTLQCAPSESTNWASTPPKSCFFGCGSDPDFQVWDERSSQLRF